MPLLHSAHSASLIRAARSQNGGHRGFIRSSGQRRKQGAHKRNGERKASACAETSLDHFDMPSRNMAVRTCSTHYHSKLKTSDLTSSPTINFFRRSRGNVPVNDMPASLASSAHNAHGLSLPPTFPALAPRLAKIQYGSILTSVCPASKWRFSPLSLDGDSGIRLGLLRFRGH